MISIDEIKSLEVREELRKLKAIFPNSFINDNLEFINDNLEFIAILNLSKDDIYKQYGFNKKNKRMSYFINLYFIIDERKVITKEDVKAKVLEQFSKACYKSQYSNNEDTNDLIHLYIRDKVNKYLGTNFNELDFEIIYTYLGNGAHHMLTIEFIESNYLLDLIKRGEELLENEIK